ncbi:MAG: hypothetical protein V4487_07470 [Chlamydiota bacterium]
MYDAELLKKQMRMIDLAIQAGRKRLSARTKFVHLFPSDETASDTIPIYENFCFAFALFRLKTTDAVLEGKEILERLVHFQAPNGNFPIYIHDYPRCFNPLLPLKLAPLFIHLLRLFGNVLGGELKERLECALEKMLQFSVKKREEKPLDPIWEHRFQACLNKKICDLDPTDFSAEEWAEWIISRQICEEPRSFFIPYQRGLQTFIGSTLGAAQEKGEPRPSLIEWLLAEGAFSSRLIRDHSAQLACAPLFPIECILPDIDDCSLQGKEGAFRLLWKGETLHSLAAFKGSEIQIEGKKAELYFDLIGETEVSRGDLFEVALFCNISPETTLWINGKRGTVFQLGDQISIKTSLKTIDLKIELIQGDGNFCGRLFFANRPTQVACKGALLYEAYDWQIGLRTLSRSGDCRIRIALEISEIAQ